MDSINSKLDIFYYFLLRILLIIGNVELNPGPKNGSFNDLSDLDSITEESEYLSEQFDAHEKERFLQTSVKDLPNEIFKLCEEKTQLKRKIKNEYMENKRLKTEVEQRNKRINELESKVGKLEKEINNQASEKTHQQETQQLLQTPVKELAREVEKICKEKHDLKIEVENRNKEIENLKSEIKMLKEQNGTEAYISAPIVPGLGDEILRACECRNWTHCVTLLEEKLDKKSIPYHQLQGVSEDLEFLPWDIVKKGYLQLFQVFHKNGLPLNIRKNSIYNETFLHVAASSNQIDIVNYLITRVDNINVRDSINDTPLHNAARMGLVDIVSLLLNNNASINVCNYCNRTPLHHAVQYSNVSVVECLLRSNCNKTSVDINGKTALDIAREKNFIEIVQILS